MAIYDETVKKYKQYLKDAQIEALMEKSRQYNRENAGNRADAVSQARSDYDTAYRGLQNMGLAGAKGTELTGEVPRLKTNIAGQFNRVNAQLYNREQQAVEALGGQYAAQTKAEQAAAAAARAAAESQAEAEEAAKRNAVGGLVTGAVSAAMAGQTKPNANTATLIPSKGQRIGMETAAKARGTGGMVTAATAAAIAQQEFEQKKALAAMQALGIRRSKFASSPTQKTAAQTTVNALQSAQTAQQEYLSTMEMLRRAQAGAQRDPRAGSGVAYYADRVGEILSNATIPTEQRVQMAMEYLQADVDEKTSPLADRKAKEIIARAYGLKVPKSDETFDALYKASRSKPGGLGYGVGATYDKDAEIAFRQEQSNRAEYDYFIPAIANSIRYAGKKAEPEKGVNNDIYAIINGQLTSNYLTLAERKNNLPTPYQKKMQKFEFLTDEEKNAYNWLYKNKGLDKANEYAESLTPFLLERNNAYTQEEWTKVANKSWVGASILSVPMAIGEVPAAVRKMGLGLYNTVSKDAKYIDINDPTETMSTIRSTIRSASSQKILGLDKENHEPTKAQKAANFFYSAGMSTADSAFLGLMAKFGGWRGITDVIFFSSSFGDKYKEAVASGANQQQAFNAAVASGAAETIFEHISIDKFLDSFLAAPLKGATRVARFVEMLKKIGLQALIEGSEEMFTGIANLFTDQMFLGELSENAKSKAAYIQEALANGLSQKDAEKQAEKRVVAETIQNIGLETLAGALSGGMFGIFGAGMNKVHFSEMGRRLRGDTNVYDQVIQNAKMLGGETAEMARNIEQAGSKATDSAIGELYNASYEATRKLLKTDNRDTAAVLLAGEKITESQAEGMLEESGDVLKEAGYDTSSPEALAASYNQRVEEVATAQKEAFDNRARDYNIKRAEEVYTDKEALRNVPLTLPTGVSPVQFAEAERNNFKSRTTIQSDGVELQLSLMDMDGRFTNEQKLERARKAMTAQAQRKLDMIGKISKALGMDVVVHDYMRGSNGYFGEDGKIHFVLSGHMSVARVAAHELTHQMQSVASEKYTVVRDQLIEDVGQDRFDRLLKRKAAQYGYNMESEQGRLACDEEVIAELCEGMLSDKDRLERFAERHTDTALTLRERLTKILNAIHATLKDTFGQNQNRISDMITDEKTADKWLDGLDEVLKKVQEKQAQENKSAIQYRIDETGMSAERKAEYDEYIQNALGGPGNNNEKQFTIGKVDARISKWLERFGKKISSDAVHVIADNDIRHIRNRHGIAKEGQYGVTTGDLQAIPYILKNAKEKYFFPRSDGKYGILYVTDGVDTTYYVEEIFSEDALTGKQMIKTKKGTVPSAYENIINNKEAFLAPLDNAADAVPGMYVQDVRQYNASTDKISQADKSVKGEFSLDTDSGNLQAELYELKNQRKEMLEADEAYRKASEQRRYANTFAERVAASRALREAQEKIDTAEIDRKISELQDRISKMREEEVRKHQEEKEKYAGTKTAGYSMEPDTRLKSLDAPYMEAVKSGNKSEAQKLVQQAAEAAMPKSVVRDSKGKLLKTYHYTNSSFTAFDRSTARTGNEMDGFFFAPDAESTREYGKRQIVAYLNITNLAVDPVLDRKFDDSGTLLREKLAAQGYDGVARTENGKIYEYMVFDPEQIKLADAVTYDDAGNAIPLSERFNMGKKDFRYSLDTEQLEKTVRAIDTKALEEGLQSMNAVSNVNSFTMKDPSRFFDAISKGNESLRDELHDIFEKPHSEATGLYARNLEKMQERVKNIAKEAGVLSQDGKKFDKAASAAVQNIGEGIAPIACSVEAKVVEADTISLKATRNDSEILSGDFTLEEVVDRFGVENGNEIWDKAFDQAQKDSEKGKKASAVEYESSTSPYTIDDLKAQFPTSWERLKAAADAYREMYDEYYENMNAMLREIYPNAFTSKDDTTAKIDALVEKKKHRIADAEQAILEREKTLKKVESEMAGKKRTDTKAYDTLRRRQTRLNESIADLNELIAGYNEDVAALAVKKNAILEDKSGESLSRMHKLEFRKKYFHHFVESEKRNFIGEVWDLIINKNPQQLSPAIVGRSANSKAKSRWAGFFQQRKGPYHTPDAVNGMLRYASLAEYKLAFDPLAAYLRNAEKKIRQINDETNRNSLLLYLNTWTNQILGKSSDFDRLLTDRGVVGRNIVNALQKLNSRVIKNTLYFNARSAIVQISNISNAVSLVTNPKDWKNGVLCWSKAAKGDEMMQNIMSQSNFLASRFAGVEMIDTSIMASAEKFANKMLSIADTISAKATWWAAYNQYVRDPNSKSIMSMPRKYESAVDYADDVTRRTHGGRGVGEKAPIMTSKLVSFFAPFQLEVNNTYQLLKENIKKKNALGIATMEATVFVMNAVFEAVVGSTVLPFDFVRALIDIIFGAKDIQDDDDDDHKLASTFKLIGQRIGAETVSGLPYAGMIPQFLGEDTTEAVFGETDMTKYGNVNMGVGGAVGIGKVLASLAKWGAEGVKPDWFSMVNELSEVLPPIGGKQIARTIGGLTTVAQGYSGKTNSKGEDTVQFATDTNVLNYLHAGIFGKWALTEASEYFGEDRILPKLFGYYNGESASAGSPVKAEEFHAARALGLSGKGYFAIRKELKGYRTQEGKRSSLYTTNLTPTQKAGMDALLISTTGDSSEAKSEGAIVYGRTKREDGSWGEWKVKADYSSEDLFKLSLYGDTKYSAGTTALKNGAGIKNVLSLLDTVDAYNDANEKPMTATQKRDWLHQNVKDTKQAALLDAYILSKNKSTSVKVEGNVVYTMSLGEDGKPSVANDGTVAEWKVKADYTDDTWYAISQHGDSKYQKGLTAVRKGANPKTIRKYLDDMQAYQDSHKNQNMSSEERGQWIRKNGGTPKEQAILDAYMLRKDSNTDAKVKDGIVYTLELGEDGKPKVYKSGSVAEWKVKADYTSDEWYAASQTDHYNKAKTAYSACGIKPTVFVDFYTRWSDLSAKDASGKTVSGLKKKRTKELLDKMKISTEQKAYLYYKVCGYK